MKKHPINVGDTVTIPAQEYMGFDKIVYSILPFFGTGRDWAANMWYELYSKEMKLVGVVTKVEKWEAKTLVSVQLSHESLALPVRGFSKRPYIRKDGSFNHIQSEQPILLNSSLIYPVFQGKATFEKRFVKKAEVAVA